ncbi:type II toxin-antitoxin system Phd/YefM family antitoxin [Pseudomonas gingeri]|uniref:type II toxin-antitoxin system Phd/YefM family antitoxin n=1 Tax=Pseudomonas gingeri TaxID=117681 RepID=UPI0015A1E997|nr:type II toxin-antitoxin system Phd/YefM family antitoxin [Pseudomonas gingeri]NVZ25638.1 type II toxin-antitoxin system Phd/YefM family antitoxin [Pseudomonas gingeri]NWE71530.1 type II toxin-antitoxin system Phd/YefM family antitoxin [Pseudomonas gingeri]
MQSVLSNRVVSVSELKKNPSAVLSEAGGEPVAVLNHNRVMGYMVPADVFEMMMERLDDLELAQLARERIEANEPPVRVSLDDLIAEAQADIEHGR